MELSEDQQELGHLVMDALSVLLTGNSANAGTVILDNYDGFLSKWFYSFTVENVETVIS